ncbi:Calcium-dependent protein kinase 18 [Folsomia candida]|uniref:Calcium-dependent protein kinase 18 n=1 Tax=Folsomia candida TaxID=158441 RepID=A0A226DTW7_FOLCA|nr:Calcium-dependent protein kinase 18 [Folsomia candida]
MAKKDLANTDLQVSNDFIDNITTFESFLGHGAFGIVLKAKISSDFYAVKFILLNKTLTQDEARREFEIPLALDEHDTIVKIHQFVENKVLSVSQVEKILQLSHPAIDHSGEEALRHGESIKWTCIQMELCGRSFKHWLDEFKPLKDSNFDSNEASRHCEKLGGWRSLAELGVRRVRPTYRPTLSNGPRGGRYVEGSGPRPLYFVIYILFELIQ